MAYNKIKDLLFLSDAIALPYYDFVVGIEEVDVEAIAYNETDAELIKDHLLRLKGPTILHLSHQMAPPKDTLSSLLAKTNINHVGSRYGVAIIHPGEDIEVQFIKTPKVLLDPPSVCEEDPEKLLNMLKRRLIEFDGVSE